MSLRRVAFGCGLLLFFFFFHQVQSAASSSGTIHIEFRRNEGAFEANAVFAGVRTRLPLPGTAKEFTARMKRLYSRLEKRNDEYDLAKELEEFGSLIYGPIQYAIGKCELVAIRIPPILMRLPFEQMFWRGKPLGLQKPVVVHFEQMSAESFSMRDIRSALVLADITADPEEACLAASKRLPKAAYYSMDDVERKFFKHLPEKDLLLVSAHGDVIFSEDDCIEYDDKKVYPESWAKAAPKLAYFDSCRVGASRAFIEAFEEAGTQYFLAPIVSNEAGNSSTRTIESFFGALKAGETPERALFLTRVKLYEHFSGLKQSSFGKMLYRVLPFRVYRLN